VTQEAPTSPSYRHGNYDKEVVFDQKICKMVILREITDLVRAEYARSVEKISDIMIASTSHDMRTPLNTIVSMLNMIEKRLEDLNLLKWLKVAKHSTDLLLCLVNDTLDYYQIKSGKFRSRLGAFNIKELVE
jgi:signal transduction histidine kinase